MAGQLIVLPGVVAAAAAGAPRVNMNGPDTVASKITSLANVVSARTLTALPGGGVSGRCRATGAILTPKGSSATDLALYDVNGRAALGTRFASAAGLALPGGSLTKSFTLVAAINLSAADRAGTNAVNFLTGFNASGSNISALLRSYGATGATLPGKVATGTTTTTGALLSANAPTGVWGIVTVDYNNDTRTLSIAVDQGSTFATRVLTDAFNPPEGSYLELGYEAGGSAGLRESRIGDVYSFNDSLQRTPLGKTQTVDLVNQLKAYYSIP